MYTYLFKSVSTNIKETLEFIQGTPTAELRLETLPSGVKIGFPLRGIDILVLQ